MYRKRARKCTPRPANRKITTTKDTKVHEANPIRFLRETLESLVVNGLL